MTGNTNRDRASALYRKKRVKRIKKIIVTGVVILILLPTVLSIFLMIKMASLERRVEQLAAGSCIRMFMQGPLSGTGRTVMKTDFTARAFTAVLTIWKSASPEMMGGSASTPGMIIWARALPARRFSA